MGMSAGVSDSGMSDRALTLDDATLKIGLLMESAQAHQKLAETHLEQLRAHTAGIDGIVREEIRRTLIEELKMLVAESRRATLALRRMGRGAAVRSAMVCALTAVVCTAVPASIMRWVLPSEAQIAALQARRDQLTASVATLEQRGGKIDWRRCGDAKRVCVHVDRAAPVYGRHADYYVVAGY